MSPVIGLGARCRRCHKRPVWADALCNPCWRLSAAVGARAVEVTAGEDPSSEILDADSIEFGVRLAAWLYGTDPPTAVP